MDTVQVDADELFTADSVNLEDIRIFKGGRIDRAILYAASVLNHSCETLRGLFRQIIEDRTEILYPVKDLEVHHGLGFAAWCDNNRVLIGNRLYMEREGVPLPEQEYEDEHSQNGALQILYLAVSGSLHAMFVLHYVGGRNAARGLEVLQRENIRLLVTCEDPSLTARHITEAYHLPEGMITLLDREQCSALTPAQPDETARCCMLHDKGFASLIGGLRAAEKGPERRDERHHGADGLGLVLGGHRCSADLRGQHRHPVGGRCPDVSGSLECFEHCGLRPETAQLNVSAAFGCLRREQLLALMFCTKNRKKLEFPTKSGAKAQHFGRKT